MPIPKLKFGDDASIREAGELARKARAAVRSAWVRGPAHPHEHKRPSCFFCGAQLGAEDRAASGDHFAHVACLGEYRDLAIRSGFRA